MNPIRVNQKQACQLLAISREKIRQLLDSDPTFPKPYKDGNKRQSHVYYDYNDLVKWHKQQGA